MKKPNCLIKLAHRLKVFFSLQSSHSAAFCARALNSERSNSWSSHFQFRSCCEETSGGFSKGCDESVPLSNRGLKRRWEEEAEEAESREVKYLVIYFHYLIMLQKRNNHRAQLKALYLISTHFKPSKVGHLIVGVQLRTLVHSLVFRPDLGIGFYGFLKNKNS